MTVHFTLIHGTFARQAGWTSSSSFFRRVLNTQFPDAIIDVFGWSGQNSITARYQASLELRDQIEKVHARNPDIRHFLVGHSHGGTIALQSADSPSIAALLSGIVCLSTPFVSPRKRTSDATYFVRTPLGAWTFVALLGTGAMWLLLKATSMSDTWRLWVAIVTASLVGALTFLLLNSKRYATRIEELASQMRLPESSPCATFILRTLADEATGLLVSARFVTWLADRVWQALLWPYKKYVAFERRDRGTIGFVAVLVSTLSCLPWFALQMHNKSVGRPIHNLPLWLFCVALLPIVLWQTIESANFVLLLASMITFPLLVGTGLALALSVGREMLWASFRLDVAVEATPPGSWSVSTYEIKDGVVADLLHSSLYEDEHAVKTICEWIQQSVK